MPSFALVGLRRLPRWLPPLPVPLFLLWPFVPLCLGLARLLDRDRPEDAAKLRAAMRVFRELRGLAVEVDTADDRHVRIKFV
jgi:hypothetical protein